MHPSPLRWRNRLNLLRSSRPLLLKRLRKRKNSRKNFGQQECVLEPSLTPFPSEPSLGASTPYTYLRNGLTPFYVPVLMRVGVFCDRIWGAESVAEPVS